MPNRSSYGNLTKEEIFIYKKMEQEFMKPQVVKFSRAQAIEYDAGTRAGYYCRLSAPGYLDCTDWSGPFQSPTKAARNLIDIWGDIYFQ